MAAAKIIKRGKIRSLGPKIGAARHLKPTRMGWDAVDEASLESFSCERSIAMDRSQAGKKK